MPNFNTPEQLPEQFTKKIATMARCNNFHNSSLNQIANLTRYLGSHNSTRISFITFSAKITTDFQIEGHCVYLEKINEWLEDSQSIFCTPKMYVRECLFSLPVQMY